MNSTVRYVKEKSEFSLVVLVIGTLLYSAHFLLTNYVDIGTRCFIDIDRQIGNQSNPDIKLALRYLRSNDRDAYNKVCSNIDTIGVKRCLPGDPRVDNTYRGAEREILGCTVTGSKRIYLSPYTLNSETAPADVAEAIVRYTDFSIRY